MRAWPMKETIVAIGLGLPLLATGALVTAQGGGRGERCGRHHLRRWLAAGCRVAVGAPASAVEL